MKSKEKPDCCESKGKLDCCRLCKLLEYLCCNGLDNIPPELLCDPKGHTRPNVRLVAYYPKIWQKAVGGATRFLTLSPKSSLLALLIAVISIVLTAIDAMDLANVFFIVLFLVQVIALFVLMGLVGWFIFFELRSVRADLCLTRDELSLELPDGLHHVPWSEVYSASPDPKPDWIRVQLQNGVAARLKMPCDRDLIVKVMTKLILCHRRDGNCHCNEK